MGRLAAVIRAPRGAALLACAASWTAGFASAQSDLTAAAGGKGSVLEIHLAADLQDASATGWSRVRTDLLPRFGLDLESVSDRDLQLTVTGLDDGSIRFTTRAAEPLDDPDLALRFELRSEEGSTPWLRGFELRSGKACWELGTPPETLPRSVVELVRRFGFECRTGWLELDVASLLGDLDRDPAHDELLRWIALDCGNVAVLARPEHEGGWTIRAAGRSGLLLPALLAVQCLPKHSATPPALADDLDHWLGMLRTSNGEERAEAVRQLGRFEDPRAVTALTDLLWEGDTLSDHAVLALARGAHPDARQALRKTLPALHARSPGLARHVARAVLPAELLASAFPVPAPEVPAAVARARTQRRQPPDAGEGKAGEDGFGAAEIGLILAAGTLLLLLASRRP